VRYIHLNGIRAGVVKDMDELDRDGWSGHSVIMGTQEGRWQAREEVLSHFGKREEAAKKKYRQFISEAIKLGKRNDFAPEIAEKDKETRIGKRPVDSRILGCESFSEKILTRVGSLDRNRLLLKRRKIDMEGLLSFLTEELDVTSEEVKGGSRRRNISKARSAFCYICMTQFGVPGKRLSDALGMTPSAIYLSCLRGEAFVNRNPDLKRSIALYLNNLRTSP
jgi:hypothetical protein